MQEMNKPDNSSHEKNILRSFRINESGSGCELVQDLLRAEGFVFEPEPFSPAAFRLRHEPFPLGSSLAAFFGLIYIQDRSSMLPPLILHPEPGTGVLDMCASPGSKSGFLSLLTGPAGLVLANEPNHSRLGTLRANLGQQNFLQAATCCFQGQDIPLPPESCPYILLDPPCSGWGTVEKNPQAIKLWSSEKARTLAGLQQLLLSKAAWLLMPGGELVYSTCTTNPAENEAQVGWALDNLPLEQIPLHPIPGFDSALSLREKAISIAPCRGEGQGFFMAKFRRRPGPAPALPEPPDPLRKSACRRKTKGGEGKTAEGTAQDYMPALLSRRLLDSEITDSSLLPPGELAEHRGRVMFLPQRLLQTAPPFPVQGTFVAKLAQGAALPLPHMRSLLVPAGNGPGLDVEDIAPIRQLLSGQSLSVNLPGKNRIALYYKSLPLGILRIINGRAIWAER